jgi:hypothetical protein
VVNIIHLWSFDPGETTGWCHLSIHDGEVGVFSCGETDHLGIGNLLFDNPSLKAAVSKRDVVETIFIVEKFIMNAKITQSPWSLETTGLIRYFADHNEIPVVFQSPSQAKSLVKNEVIQRAGLYIAGKGHAMDSVRHALYYLIVKKGLLKECLISKG